MRSLLLAAVLVAAPSALAQDAVPTLDEASVDALASIGTPDLAGARLLTAAERTELEIEADEPIWVVPVDIAPPSLGYELPETLRPSEKEVGIGILVGVLVAGGGQLYAGDTSKGLKLLAVGLGAPIVGYIATIATDNIAPYLVGTLVGLGAWVYGIVETPDDVRAANARNGFAVAPAVIHSEGRTAAGLSLSATF